MPRILYIGCVVAFLALHAFLKQRSPTVMPGASMAESLAQVSDPAARELTQIAREHRVTVVTFFETWCGPCKLEMPMLSNLYRNHSSEGLAVVGIYGASSTDVPGFREQHNITFPTLIDDNGALAGVWEVTAVPTTVVLDRNLEVLSTARGYQPGLGDRITGLLSGEGAP